MMSNSILGTRLFSILPLYSYQRRHIPISIHSLYYILSANPQYRRLFPGIGLTHVRRNFEEYYWKLFNFKKIGIKSLEKVFDLGRHLITFV